MTLQTILTAVTAVRVSRRVAVIGGGSGGVVTARFLKRAGHSATLFEAGSAFGGVWADDPTNDVVYQGLQTNLPTVVMQSPDLDFEPGVPSYIDKRALGRYITRYADEFGVAQLAQFGATVTSVTPTADDRGWEVKWTCDGATQSANFDAVVVANGHYDKPFVPSLPGEGEWLAGDASRSIVHSRRFDDPAEFAGQSVLVVGGRSSGVDIARMLNGVASWVYVLEKKCEAAVTHENQAVTHVPLGTRLCADGRLRVGGDGNSGGGGAGAAKEPPAEPVPGPPVQRVILATGFEYSFPFLDEAAVGMVFKGKRYVTPLYQHMLHVSRPSLGFVGVPLAVPCPIPYFECQAYFMAEHLARGGGGGSGDGSGDELTTEEERARWLEQRMEAVGFETGRPMDLHFTSAGGGSPWGYMRELLRAVHAARPPPVADDGASADGEATSWVERADCFARLETVEAVYSDRGGRYPKLPWHDDAYRRCEYTVDWARGTWSVDETGATRAKRPREQEQEACEAAQ